ncbi:MAG TPA: hypothetical protein VIU12_14960 [Chryseolinea sp.]
MQPDKTELAKRYANFSNDRLLDILYHKEDYTAEALEAVKAEIDTRQIGVDELETFTVEKKVDRIINEENARVPLSLRAKLFFFFAWFIPIAPLAFRMNYREDGFATKLWQSRFFRITGFVSLVVSALLSVWLELGDPGTFGLLVVLFGAAYSMDPKKRMTIESEM